MKRVRLPPFGTKSRSVDDRRRREGRAPRRSGGGPTPRVRLKPEVEIPELPRRKRPRRSRQKPRDDSERNYKIGKGKPPAEHTWKPGQCGNPNGRPKGRKNEATIWKEITNKKITLPISGKTETVTIQEGIQYRIVSDALAGNIKSAAFVLNRLALIAAGEPASISDLSDDDRKVLEDFARRLKDDLEGA